MGLSHEDWVIKYRDALRGSHPEKAILIRLDNEHYTNERLEAIAWDDENYNVCYTRRTDSTTEQRDRPIETWCSHYDQIQGLGVVGNGEHFVDIGKELGYPEDKLKAIADSFILDIQDYADSVKNNHSSYKNPRHDIVY